MQGKEKRQQPEGRRRRLRQPLSVPGAGEGVSVVRKVREEGEGSYRVSGDAQRAHMLYPCSLAALRRGALCGLCLPLLGPFG